MKLNELMNQHRLLLEDESVGVRRSWEEVFRYTLKVYPADIAMEAFDLQVLADGLISLGLHPRLVDGYVKRWRDLLSKTTGFRGGA